MSLLMEEKDWYIRQIRTIVQVLAKGILGTDFEEFQEDLNLPEPVSEPYAPGALYLKLRAMLERQELCPAEDLLFSYLDRDKPDFLPVALDFYRLLSEYPPEYLLACGFSREEVSQGLRDAAAVYGYDGPLPEV